MLHKLPQQITQSALDKLADTDEATAILVQAKCPSVGRYTVRGKTTRRFVFPFYPTGKRKGHLLRIPLSVWESRDMALAKELLDQVNLPIPLIVSAEPWKQAAPKKTPIAPPTQEPTPERDTDPAPQGPGLAAVPAPEPAPEPAITRKGDEFFLGEEKIGGINAAGRLQMSQGKTAHRAAVEAFLEQ